MKRNIMLLLCGAALTASAQTDVTADYLTHYDFDSGFHHKAGATTEVKQEIKTITGWIDNTEEQWPYRVRFYQTNVYGEANNDDVPTGVEGVEDTEARRLCHTRPQRTKAGTGCTGAPQPSPRHLRRRRQESGEISCHV